LSQYYFDIETVPLEQYRSDVGASFDPLRARIISIQYQRLDGAAGRPAQQLVILKEWEPGSSEGAIVEQFKKVFIDNGSNAWRKMYHYFILNRDDFMKHYHQRSNCETVFHMIKSKFKDNVRSKDKVAQLNEVLLKILCHNICVVIQEMHELGVDANFTDRGI
jgi:hypothetical protein